MTGTPDLMMPGLFGGNLGECVTEPLLVIELDVGDDTGQRGDDVRRVEPPAQAGFPNHQVTFLFGEKLQRHHRDDFKKRRMMTVGKMLEQRLQFLRPTG